MFILEFIFGLLLFALVANFFLALIPIPRGIAGTLVALLVIYFAWRLVF